MSRHRKRGLGRVPVVLAALAIGTGVLALPFLWPDRASSPAQARSGATDVLLPFVEPTSRATPKYLTTTYRAPPKLVRAGAGGRLQIPSLGIRAPVDAVGLDGTAMAVPNDPARVGWLTRTARAGDLVGDSVLAGHVSDEHDRPGALNRLDRIRVGAMIIWTDRGGHERRFTVVRIQRFARDRGLPASMFSTTGRHELRLVTCAGRVSTPGGGFHYTSNLVVSAVR